MMKMGRLGKFSYDRLVPSETKQLYGATPLRGNVFYGSRTATAKAIFFYQHTKIFDNATTDTVNLGGATGIFERIWGGMMFPGLATVGVSGTAFTFDGATLVVPAGVATTGGIVNFLLLGSR